MRNEISERLVDFASEVIRLVEKIPAKTTAKKLSDQLLRSATSVGANYEEAQGAESKADFVHKFQIALEEIREAHYWLRVVGKSMPSLELHPLIDEARQIRAILYIETLAPFDEAFTDSEQLAAAAFASNSMKIAFGENAGKNVRRIGRTFGFLGEHALIKSTRCAVVNGFSLHANRYVGEKERSKLEKLFSYAARPSFSNKRLTLKEQGHLAGDYIYELKSQWSDGTTAVQLSREELFEKLAALIPPPYIHLSRHFGVFSSSSKWRRMIVTKPEVKKGFTLCKEKGSVTRMTWSKLLARVFKIDVSRCGNCQRWLNPDQWERVDKQPHIALMLVALNIEPHPSDDNASRKC